jgi:hypothetical protein
MKKIFRITLIALLLTFVLIQFIPNDMPGNEPMKGMDIFEISDIPEEVGIHLKNACYDCHSHYVSHPWYASIAPASWLVAKDIREGRKELDFSAWGSLSLRDQLKQLVDISEVVHEETMPLPVYTFMHADARLNSEQREAIIRWAESYAESLLE